MNDAHEGVGPQGALAPPPETPMLVSAAGGGAAPQAVPVSVVTSGTVLLNDPDLP